LLPQLVTNTEDTNNAETRMAIVKIDFFIVFEFKLFIE
jgi:hypothetical protein